MVTKSIKKILIALLVVFAFFTINFRGYDVKAASIDQEIYSLDEIFNTEEKIMMYDATTGETTEVNMEKLRQDAISLFREDGSISLNGSNPSELSYASMNPVTDMNSFNAKTTCKIICDQGRSSASLVGSNIALTAAHCIWDEKTKAKYTNLKFYPAYSNGSSYNNLSCGWSRVYYSSDWMNNPNPKAENDWAICVLEQPLGASCGYLGLRQYTLSQALGMVSKLANVYGYPIAYNNGNTLYNMSTYITGCNISIFTYNGDASQGMSGGPVIGRDSGDIIAVHSSRSATESSGCRITGNMMSIIKELRG